MARNNEKGQKATMYCEPCFPIELMNLYIYPERMTDFEQDRAEQKLFFLTCSSRFLRPNYLFQLPIAMYVLDLYKVS